MVAINAIPVATNQGFKSFVPNLDLLDAGFLYHWLRTNRPALERLGVGATFKEVSKAIVARIKVPLPPIDQQRRIAATLDRAEEVRATRRAAIALLDQLPQAIFHDMFGDPATNPKNWDTRPLTALCCDPDDIKCGPFGTQLHRSDFTASGVPLWGIKHVNAAFQIPTHEFVSAITGNRLRQYNLLPGDVVMTRKGTVGNCAVYPNSLSPGVMHSDLLRIRIDSTKWSSAFLSHQLHASRDIEHQISLISGGAVMAGINVTKLKALLVRVPPSDLQQQFAARLEAIQSAKLVQQSSLAELDALFASLQDRAFRP